MHVHGKATRETQNVLRFSLALTAGYIALTLFAGWRAHSLALLSEAGHNASDFLALLLSFVAVYFQTRPATHKKTFGYQRAGVLAAFVNAGTLLLIAIVIAGEAVVRLRAPVAVQPRLMMEVAAIGLVMNGVIAALLARSSRDVNIRSTMIHMLGDALSTAAVLLGAVGIWYWHIAWIDPALSLVIAALVFWSSLGIVRETLNILLEGTPAGIELPSILEEMRSVTGVLDVHDLHVWSLGSNTHALASHVTIEDIPPSASAEILETLQAKLRDKFRIRHSTIQFEHVDCGILDDCMQAVEEAHDHDHHHGHAHHHAH
jgi:cobalt-zinc-cadmium efflux system protein